MIRPPARMTTPVVALALALALALAGCGAGDDASAERERACEAITGMRAAFDAGDWDRLHAASKTARTAIARSGDDDLAVLRDAVVGVRNSALADTFWVPPEERELVERLVAARPADLSPQDRRIRAEIVATRLPDSPDRLPDPPRDAAGARAFLDAAAAECA